MSNGTAPTNEDRRAEGSVRVVGTAHISADSVEEVERVVHEERPDVVAVELDERRFRQLKGETPEDLDPKDLLRGSMAFQFLAYWLLSYIQKQLGDRFDIEPGADMKAAVDTAEEIGAGVALVDRACDSGRRSVSSGNSFSPCSASPAVRTTKSSTRTT